MKKNIDIQELCLFQIDQILCGLDVSHIVEISTQVVITPVYATPEIIEGVANLRGQIVTILNLKKIFHLPTQSSENCNSHLLITNHSHHERVGILVDEVETIVPVDQSQYESTTPGIAEENKLFYSGVYKLDLGLVAILDLDSILDYATKICIDHEASAVI